MLGKLFHAWENRLAAKDTNRFVRNFQWGTEFTADGSVEDPRTHLISFAGAALENSKRFFTPEAVTDYAISDGHLTYSSPLPSRYPSNNQVHARFFPTNSAGRAVLVLPQWNSDANGHMALCRLLNRFGVSALRLTLPFHDLRMPAESVRAEFMVSRNVGRTLQAVRQAVMDCRAALDWLESRGYTRIGVLGTSLGSCVALITQACDERVRTSALNHVSTYFADVVWTGLATRHVRAALEDHISLDDLRTIWMPISPRAHFDKLCGTSKRALLVHARYDTTFLPCFSAQALADFRRLGIHHSHLPLPCGHYSSGQFPFNIFLGVSICAYLRKNL